MQLSNSNSAAKHVFVASLFFLFALGFRLIFVINLEFPLNDGGLFTLMVEELVENYFQLPNFTEYNLSNIPYVYPPLGFYLASTIIKISRISVLDLMRVLPPILSSFTVPAFYFLSKRLLKSDLTTLIATGIYVFVPRSWMWLVMGGGLTRSLGVLFAILGVLFAHRLFQNGNNKDLIWTAVFTSLTILSHPETGVFAVFSIILIYLIFSRTWMGFYRLFFVGLGTLVLSSVWWLPAILRHGIKPLLAAFGTSGLGLNFIKEAFLFGITDKFGSHVIATLAIVGFFYLLSQKKLFIPLWLVCTLIVTPRSGGNFAVILVAMLGGFAITDVILPILNKGKPGDKTDGLPVNKNYSRVALFFILYMFISIVLSANMQFYKNDTVLHSLTQKDVAGMEWVAKHTAPDSKFVIITEYTIWSDYYNEWFPYFAERQSLNTVQGSEWLPGNSFDINYTTYYAIRECLGFYPDCLETQAKEYEIPLTHVYLPKNAGLPLVLDTIEALKVNKTFTLIYDSPAAAVFEYHP